MRRREFTLGLAGVATQWPLGGRAQQAGRPVIGFLQGRSAETAVGLVAAFKQGLRELGFVEGQNVDIEFRYANGQYDKMAGLTAELVNRRVNVIAAGYPSGRFAKAATSTIPIVFIGGSDPVRAGLVDSINRPGGNLTGVSVLAGDLETKRIQLLHELLPRAAVIGALIDANDPQAKFQSEDVESAGHRLGVATRSINVGSEREFDNAFDTLVRERADALIVTASVFFNVNRDRIIALAARHAIPAVYELREFADSGGLMTYSPSLTEIFRQAGMYTARVLKGDSPADLPVLLPAKFEFVLNLKTAKALGLDVPQTLLVSADEVIE
jgi:putative tryptophan/tyrosine transport system substrate-binding protein